MAKPSERNPMKCVNWIKFPLQDSTNIKDWPTAHSLVLPLLDRSNSLQIISIICRHVWGAKVLSLPPRLPSMGWLLLIIKDSRPWVIRLLILLAQWHWNPATGGLSSARIADNNNGLVMMMMMIIWGGSGCWQLTLLPTTAASTWLPDPLVAISSPLGSCFSCWLSLVKLYLFHFLALAVKECSPHGAAAMD